MRKVFDFILRILGILAVLIAVIAIHDWEGFRAEIFRIYWSVANSASSSTSATPNQTKISNEYPGTVDLSETNMEIGACAGRLMWLAAFTKKVAPTDPGTFEIQQFAFWFQHQANEIAGKSNGMALSYKTTEWLNDRYKKVGEKPLLLELMADTWSCPDTVMKLRPSTKACFELEQSSSPLTPRAYKFKCARREDGSARQE